MKKNKIKKQGSRSQENSWHAALLFRWENNGQISEHNRPSYKKYVFPEMLYYNVFEKRS